MNMISNEKALGALMHSIAMLTKANGNAAEMKNIMSCCRADSASSHRIELVEDSLTVTSSAGFQCQRKAESVVGIEHENAVKSISSIGEWRETCPRSEFSRR